VFNCYRGKAPILWRDKISTHSIWIHLREGVAQGDPLAMAVFCIATIDVLKLACKEVGALAEPIPLDQLNDLPQAQDREIWQPSWRGADGGRLKAPSSHINRSSS